MVGWKVQQWRKNTKERLIKGFGGCCNKCQYKDYSGALDFHHIDPKTKKFTIASALASPKSWDLILEEALKCVMLCNRCHSELHGGLWSLDDIEIIPLDETPTEYKKDTPTGNCVVCEKVVYMSQICCSRECAAKRSTKIDWPNKTNLQKLLNQQSRSAVARMLGVSEAAVRKREKKYGITI